MCSLLLYATGPCENWDRSAKQHTDLAAPDSWSKVSLSDTDGVPCRRSCTGRSCDCPQAVLGVSKQGSQMFPAQLAAPQALPCSNDMSNNFLHTKAHDWAGVTTNP